MKSSDKPYERGFLSNNPGYSLLALYMPLTILAAFIFLVEALLPVTMPSALCIICGAASGIAASLYCDFIKDSKASRLSANIRGAVIIVIAAYILVSLFEAGKSFTQKFIPDVNNILAVLSALYAWTSVITLKTFFSARKTFEIYTEMYSGEKLKSVLYEDSSLLQYTDEKITKTITRYYAQLVFIGLLTLVSMAINTRLPVSLNILLIVILAGAVCLSGFFEIIRWEQYYAGEGTGLSVNDRNKRILAIIILTFFCVAAAVLLASDSSILPFSLIISFLLWLLSLFRREPIQIERRQNMDPLGGMEIPQGLPQLAESARSPFWDKFWDYFFAFFKYGFIALIAAGFIFFMISPLINRGKADKKLTFSQRLVRIIIEWFKQMSEAVASFLEYLKKSKIKNKLRSYDAQEIRRAAENLLNAYSPGKRKDIKQSFTLFARLIIWGSQNRGVSWKPSHAPGEYCALLSGTAPLAETEDTPESRIALIKQNENILRCGELFEKALYSAEELSEEERKEFKELIEEITVNPY